MNELDYYSFLDEDTKNKLNKGEKINCDKATMILLTHHLLYVFYGKINNEQLFKVGAYVISKIVKDYYDGQIYDNNSNYQCNNHHSSRELFNQFVNSHLVYSQDNDTWYLKASIPANENIKKYFVSNNLIKNNYVKFVPNATQPITTSCLTVLIFIVVSYFPKNLWILIILKICQEDYLT